MLMFPIIYYINIYYVVYYLFIRDNYRIVLTEVILLNNKKIIGFIWFNNGIKI